MLTGIPTRTIADWATAGSQHTATISVIEAFNPHVNWPLGYACRQVWGCACWIVKSVCRQISAFLPLLMLFLFHVK
eukprot:364655-Chlamydomonas_euryale.AAC.1